MFLIYFVDFILIILWKLMQRFISTLALSVVGLAICSLQLFSGMITLLIGLVLLPVMAVVAVTPFRTSAFKFYSWLLYDFETIPAQVVAPMLRKWKERMSK